jgi:putative peptidoglycan lipid II flippase
VAAGIAAATTVAGVAQTVVSALVLRRRMGGIDGARLARRLGVFALATIPAAVAGLALLWLLGGLTLGPDGVTAGSGFATSDRGPALVAVVLVGALTALVYLGVLALARIPELADLLSPLRRILRRP